MGPRVGLRPWRKHITVLLAGTMLALIVLVLAPGNAVRRAEYPSPPDPLTLARTSFMDTGHFLKSVARSDAMTLVTVAAIAAYLGFHMGSGRRTAGSLKRLLGVLCAMALGGVALLVVLMLPVEYATRSYPSARALTTAQFVLAAGVVGSACLTGIGLARGRASPGRWGRAGSSLAACIVITCAIASSVTSIMSTQTLAKDAREFAVAWDQRDARIRSAVADGFRSISVPSLSSMGTLEEIKYEADDWVNVCVAEFYGLDQVVAK